MQRTKFGLKAAIFQRSRVGVSQFKTGPDELDMTAPDGPGRRSEPPADP